MAKSNIQYWYDRQLATFNSGEKDILELAKELESQYKKSLKTIQGQINAFYGRYARESGLDIKAIKKLLSNEELKDFHTLLNEYIEFAKENGASKEYLQRLLLLKYKVKVSRATELKTQIEYEIAKLQTITNEMTNSELADIYGDIYLRNIYNLDVFNGKAISFAKPNIKAATKYLKNGFDIANYSIAGEHAVWTNIEKLVNILNTRIPQGLILGQNPRKVARIAKDTLGTSFNSTLRLVRTEYSYILNQCTKDSYEECGIARYQLLVALDERTCDNCGQWDLYVGYYKDIEVGVNYPPFHPNCRCTTIPYFDPDEFDTKSERIAKDENGKPYMVAADLTFKEWKAGLTEHEGGIMYFTR